MRSALDSFVSHNARPSPATPLWDDVGVHDSPSRSRRRSETHVQASAATVGTRRPVTRHPRRSTARSRPRGANCTSEVSVARYYDPTTAQFLTRDPFEAITGSPYGYAGGDPLDRSDPSGLCWGPDSLCDYLTQAGESWTATVDTVTGGATRWVRHKLGIDDSYTTNSDAYQATVNLWLGPSCIDGVPVTRGEIPFMPGEVPASVERNLFELPASARTTMNEQYMFQRLSTYNGISPETASARLHAIKAENSLGGADNVVFDMSGNVFNPKTGDYLGSLTQGGR